MIGISKLSWIVSILLHGGLLALLILGPALRPTVKPVLPNGNVIQAEIIDLSSLDLPPLEEPTGPTPAELERERLAQELEQQRIEDLAQKQKEQDEQDEQELIKVQEQKDEAERVRLKAEVDAKKADDLEKEKIQKEVVRLEAKKEEDRIKKEKNDAAVKAKELEAKKVADRIKKEKEDLAAKKEAERIIKEKVEKDRLAKIEAEKVKKRKAAAKKKLDEQLAREEQMRQMMGVENQRNKAVDNGLLARYIAQIVARVERNWNRPPGAKEGLSCTVRATQIPGGDVTSVEVVECNGSAVVQRSIEAAVYKASPLPEPADPTLFERNLVFIFEPK